MALAVVAAGWLVVLPPTTGARRAAVFLLFFTASAFVAFWVCEAHVLASTRAKRVVSALGASAVAAGLLAAVLAIPGATPGVPAAGSTAPGSAEPTPDLTKEPLFPVDPSPVQKASTPVEPTPSATSISSIEASDFFVKNYFPSALRDARKTLDDYGTPDFRQQKKRTWVDSYVSYYEDTLSIPTDQVRVVRHGEAADGFEVRFLRVRRSGTTDQVATVYVLRCADALSGSSYACSTDDLRVESSATLR